MAKKLTVSLAQMPIFLGDPARNLITFERLAAEAGRRKSHLAVFPELWSTGYALTDAKKHASDLSKGVFAELSKIATEHKISLLGSVLELRGVEVANSAPFFASNGRMMGVYRKLHLFRLMDEDKYLQPGPSTLAMDLPWGSTGVAICYDLRFPELFRKYAIDHKVLMVLVPAEWPLARIEHWRALMIARAIENQCYMIGVNTVGDIGGTIFGGHSMVVDPWGKIVVEAGEEPQLLTVDIDLDLVAEVRQRIPVFEDLRFDVYGG